MNPDPKPHRDRYDVSGNVEAEYVDVDQTVLVNKRGITSLEEIQRLEEESLATAYETLLGEVRVDTRLSCDLIRYVHARIFGDLYAWAGRWRTVNISKPGITWPPPLYIDENMRLLEKNVLRRHTAKNCRNDDSFIAAAAEIQGEFLVIHPFREGNARTIKLITDLLAAQAGRPLLAYDQSDLGRERYIEGASRAFRRDYRLFEEIIRQALAEAQRELKAGP
jgi:cell filamentation protein